METKHKLIEVLNNFDTHDAREAIRLFYSKWTFRFRLPEDDEWSESTSYSFSEFLDEEEAVRACANKIDDFIDEYYIGSKIVVQLTNSDLQVDRKFVAVFDYDCDPGISDYISSSEKTPQV